MQKTHAKKYCSLITLLLMVFSTTSFAGVYSFEDEETTCFLFKKNKLSKSSKCKYGGADGGAAAGYGIYQREFKIKNRGTYKIVDDTTWSYNSKGEMINQKNTTLLNDVQAKQSYRDSKTLKKLSSKTVNKYIANLSSSNQKTRAAAQSALLMCYSAKKIQTEICYAEENN